MHRNAGVGLLEYFERTAGGKHLDASRLFLYKATRNLMGQTGDTGAFLRTTMQALSCSARRPRSTGRTTWPPSTTSPPPSVLLRPEYKSIHTTASTRWEPRRRICWPISRPTWPPAAGDVRLHRLQLLHPGGE